MFSNPLNSGEDLFASCPVKFCNNLKANMIFGSNVGEAVVRWRLVVIDEKVGAAEVPLIRDLDRISEEINGDKGLTDWRSWV